MKPALACGHGGRAGRMFVQPQQLFQPGTPLTDVAIAAPEPPQRRGELEAKLAIAGIAGPLERRAHVVVLATLLRDRRVDHRRVPLSFRRLGHRREIVRMPPQDGLGSRACGEPFQRVLADWLRQDEVWLSCGMWPTRL